VGLALAGRILRVCVGRELARGRASSASSSVIEGRCACSCTSASIRSSTHSRCSSPRGRLFLDLVTPPATMRIPWYGSSHLGEWPHRRARCSLPTRASWRAAVPVHGGGAVNRAPLTRSGPAFTLPINNKVSPHRTRASECTHLSGKVPSLQLRAHPQARLHARARRAPVSGCHCYGSVAGGLATVGRVPSWHASWAPGHRKPVAGGLNNIFRSCT
jgi:hypothetical protein